MKQLFFIFFALIVANHSGFAQKIIKVKCDMPTTLNQGEKRSINAVIYNNDTIERSGTITLELINNKTKKRVDEWFVNIFAFQFFTAEKNDSCLIKFSIQVPKSYNKHLNYRIVASTKVIKGEDDLIDIITDEVVGRITILKKEVF